MTVAFASRTEPPLPVARLRTQGLVTELRPAELAMTRTEAGAMLKVAGLQLDRDDLDLLLHHTEGWPAGLALAALSLEDQAVPGARSRASGAATGSSPSTCATRCSRACPRTAAAFVRRTSILDVLTAPLCDALLERSGSPRCSPRCCAPTSRS